MTQEQDTVRFQTERNSIMLIPEQAITEGAIMHTAFSSLAREICALTKNEGAVRFSSEPGVQWSVNMNEAFKQGYEFVVIAALKPGHLASRDDKITVYQQIPIRGGALGPDGEVQIKRNNDFTVSEFAAFLRGKKQGII